MSEIEKMYENAGIEKITLDYPDNFEPFYPEFTAEKQLSLIKCLIANGHCYFTVSIKPSEFTEYLARYVNKVWQDLTDTEKAEIRNILNEG